VNDILMQDVDLVDSSTLDDSKINDKFNIPALSDEEALALLLIFLLILIGYLIGHQRKSKSSSYTDKYSMEINWSDEDNAYIVTVPELPGCRTHGSTYEEALQNGKDAIESWIDASRAWGDPIPLPLTQADRNADNTLQTTTDIDEHKPASPYIERTTMNTQKQT
jgi:predicted RNase H-like HicB family nuclease